MGKKQQKQQAKIQQAITQAGSDGKISASELQKVYRKFGQAAIAEQLAPYALGNPNVELGKGARDLTGVRAKNGVATYTPREWQANDLASGTSKTHTVDASGLSPLFLRNASGGYTYMGAGAGSNAANGGTTADGGTPGAVPNDGSYKSIESLYQQQMDAAQAKIDEMQAKQAEEIRTLTVDFGSQITGIQSAADQRVNQLRDLMLIQQQQAASTQTLLQQQAQAAQTAYQEQARQAAALSKAYIPAVEQSATTAALGDQRNTNNSTNNTLSSLAIVSGLGTNSNLLAGLQLA